LGKRRIGNSKSFARCNLRTAVTRFLTNPMKLLNAVRRLYLSDRWLQRILLVFVVLFYGAPGILELYNWNKLFNSVVETRPGRNPSCDHLGLRKALSG
jgi:hypothetical protein